MYKISDEVMNFIEKTMKTWRVEVTAGRRRSTAETEIQRGIFQGDALSPFLFIIVMMQLNHILRKCPPGYKLSGSQRKINHLMYMVDIKLFAKKSRKLLYRQSRHRNEIWYRKMCNACNKKWQMTSD